MSLMVMPTEACACGTRLAVGLLRCPRCKAFAPRFAGVVKEEVEVPRITVAGGPSNPAAGPGEVGYIEPVAMPMVESTSTPVPMVESPSTPIPMPMVPAPASDYGSMTQAVLRALAKGRGLSASGSKADLAARLAEHDRGLT